MVSSKAGGGLPIKVTGQVSHRLNVPNWVPEQMTHKLSGLEFTQFFSTTSEAEVTEAEM